MSANISTQASTPTIESAADAWKGVIASGNKFGGQMIELYDQAGKTAGRIYSYVLENDATLTKIALVSAGVILVYQNWSSVLAGAISAVLIPSVIPGTKEKTSQIWNESETGRIGLIFAGVVGVELMPWALPGVVYGAYIGNKVQTAKEKVEKEQPDQSYFSIFWNKIRGVQATTETAKIKKIE